MLTITNFTGHPSLTLRAGFVEVSEARSDWAPDPNHPLPKFSPPRRVPHGVTLIGRFSTRARWACRLRAGTYFRCCSAAAAGLLKRLFREEAGLVRQYAATSVC